MKRNNLIKKLLVISLSSLTLTSCNIDDFLNLKDEIVNKIFPNVWAFLVQFLAFIIMCILIFFFAYKPIKNYLNKRKEALDNEVKETLNKKEEAYLHEKEAKLLIKTSKDKAQDIILKANIDANNEREKILNEASLDAKNIIDNAHKNIEEDKKKAQNEIKDELASLALSLSSKILEREVNYQDNKEIIDDFVNNIEINKEKDGQ